MIEASLPAFVQCLPNRRTVLSGLCAAVTVGCAPAASAESGARSIQFNDAWSTLVGGREIGKDRVVLDVPRLAESGNSVALKVSVTSPMTAADHVRVIQVLSEKNPVALIARFELGPRAGRAEVATNIRLATTQNIHVIAETSDGRLWGASAEVVVLIAACLDGS